MTTAVYIYIVYTVLSIAMTVWVASTLYKNGRVFLLEAFKGKDEMADSVNHLLVVGFCLVNIGFILLFCFITSTTIISILILNFLFHFLF